MESKDPTERTRELGELIASIRRADCTIPRERAIAMAWTRRPDLKPPEPIRREAPLPTTDGPTALSLSPHRGD